MKARETKPDGITLSDFMKSAKNADVLPKTRTVNGKTILKGIICNGYIFFIPKDFDNKPSDFDNKTWRAKLKLLNCRQDRDEETFVYLEDIGSTAKAVKANNF